MVAGSNPAGIAMFILDRANLRIAGSANRRATVICMTFHSR
jgi:hypothetical protein